MSSKVRSFLLGTLLLVSYPSNAAFIEQVFEYNSLESFVLDATGAGASDRLEHYFDTFDATLGTLIDVSIWATATSSAELDQFECSLGPGRCTVELPLDLLLILGPGSGLQDEAGVFTNPSSYLGVFQGGVGEHSYSSLSAVPTHAQWALEDFYTTPVHYLAYYNWLCRECSAIDDPLQVNVNGSATLRFEYNPAPLPATPVLFVIGLVAISMSKRRKRLQF